MIEDIITFYNGLPAYGKFVIIALLVGSGLSFLKKLIKIAILLAVLAILVVIFFKILQYQP
jgi:hypothetical protein